MSSTIATWSGALAATLTWRPTPLVATVRHPLLLRAPCPRAKSSRRPYRSGNDQQKARGSAIRTDGRPASRVLTGAGACYRPAGGSGEVLAGGRALRTYQCVPRPAGRRMARESCSEEGVVRLTTLPSGPRESNSRPSVLVRRVIVPVTGSDRNGRCSAARLGKSLPMSVAGLGRTCPTAVIRMNRDDESGWSSMLESATTAFLVLNWKLASLRARALPPIQPLTAWVLGVSMVWTPSVQFRASSPVSDRTTAAPAGMWS